MKKVYIKRRNATYCMITKLKKWTRDDLDQFVRYANNKKIWDNLTDAFPSPYTYDDGMKYIERALGDDPTKIFAIVSNDEVVGSIGIYPESDIYRKNAAIAYWVAEPFWGRGVATDAIKLMVRYAFETFDLTRVYAKPFSRNRASQRVLEKAGFKLEATLEKTVLKNGEYFDELIYSYRI